MSNASGLHRPLPAVVKRPRLLLHVVRALMDGEQRRVTFDQSPMAMDVWIWEVYRSVSTPSIRIRVVDDHGVVFHWNLNDIEAILKP